MKLPVTVKPVTAQDIALLRKSFFARLPDKHTERLMQQEQGLVVYLIAWYDGQPVGHGLLKWQGADDEPVSSRLSEECPDVEDLFVLEALRSQGVGTQLLKAAENLVLHRGYKMIGLAVNAEQNAPARRLYERLGYRDAGFGEYTIGGEYIDHLGQYNAWEEMCVYLIKQLNYERTENAK